MPIYARIPSNLRARLDGLVQQFIAEKEFVGCRGLEVTLPMKLAIASQACLLVLGRSARIYEDLYSILVYPAAFLVPERASRCGWCSSPPRASVGGPGVGHALGSSSRGTTCSPALTPRPIGFNVVYHEFAHYLDAEAGEVNGAPFLWRCALCTSAGRG